MTAIVTNRGLAQLTRDLAELSENPRLFRSADALEEPQGWHVRACDVCGDNALCLLTPGVGNQCYTCQSGHRPGPAAPVPHDFAQAERRRMINDAASYIEDDEPQVGALGAGAVLVIWVGFIVLIGFLYHAAHVAH